MVESKEEPKSFLRRVKEDSEKPGLKLSIPKTKIMASSLSSSWQIDCEKVELLTHLILLGSQITADGDYRHQIKRSLLLKGHGAWHAAVCGDEKNWT